MIINTYEKEFSSKATNLKLYNALIMAINHIGATIFKSEKHEFYPYGLTAFVILGESHVALHSFPEYNMVWVQISVCIDSLNIDDFFLKFEELILQT